MPIRVLSTIARATLLLSVLGVFVACSDDKTSTPSTSSSSGGGGDGGGAGDGGGGGGGGGGNGCGGLCKGAGFTDGTETDFKNGLVECQCSGTGGEVTKAACESYCSKFGVSAEKSYLSAEPGAKADKCACDGT